jgi:predicted transcriptional regulator
MIELNEIQFGILRALLFPETFDTLVEEIKATEPVIGAELKTLIEKRLVSVMDEDSRGRYKPTFYYDTDNMRAFRYQITANGIKHIEP